LVFGRAFPVVFLCGGAGSLPRNRVAEYLRAQTDLLVFYADDVWTEIASNADKNALEMEHQLADLADVVILLVESPGTFAELGAFSMYPELRKKLLPILDTKYKSDKSFINTGPVRWVDRDSVYRPSVWAPFSSILSCAADLDARLKLIPSQAHRRAHDLHSSLKHLLLLITDIVAVFAPCRPAFADFYLQSILAEPPCVDTKTLLAMARSIGLVECTQAPDGTFLYWRPSLRSKLRAEDHKQHLPFSTLRARIVSAMQSIPDAANDLAVVTSQIRAGR
jgi:hypothetical protein